MGLELHQNALLLSIFTIGYNTVEGVVSVIVGFFGGSVALVGFGLDSFVESSSAFVMIWRFKKHGKVSDEEEERIEKSATRLVAYTFFILGAYILYSSVKKLYFEEIPDTSLIGIIIALVSIIVMPILFYLKYRVGTLLQSKSLVADSKGTLACLFMSVALLCGLGLNFLFGFWQADPIAGIIIVGFLLKEGYSTFRE